MISAKEVIDQAREEVHNELVEAAKQRIKYKIKAVEDAKIILNNAERELEDELLAIESGN